MGYVPFMNNLTDAGDVVIEISRSDRALFERAALASNLSLEMFIVKNSLAAARKLLRQESKRKPARARE